MNPRLFQRFEAVLLVLSFLSLRSNGGALTTADLGPEHALKLLTQRAYLPGLPVLVRVEVRHAGGAPERELWDAEASLSADANVTLSTNRVQLRNGLGSALVAFEGGADFNLSATVGSLHISKALATAADTPVTTVGGALTDPNTVWSGVVRVTSDVTVPAGFTLTILSNTLVLIDGATSGTSANGLLISGRIQAFGTEDEPVTITCNDTDMSFRWGQIRHDSAQPSVYRFTSITRAGRAPGEGHTGTAPVIRPSNSTLRFENCSITDHAQGVRGVPGFGTPGKISQASGSDLTFIDCLLQRARMGPEISGTALLCSNTWIMDMAGPDDADGFYLHDQSAGQFVTFNSCVIADGDDDGLDTLGSTITVDDCIIRDWDNLFEDAKGISIFNGATTVRRSVIVDCTVGVAAKWSGGAPTRVTLEHCTLNGNPTNVWANLKDNAPGPFIDYRITNCVLWGTQTSIQSDFDVTNFTIGYCNISQAWPGTGNIMSDPLFVDEANHDYHLLPYSPCIDSGSPASPPDPDGSSTDLGRFTFILPKPLLSSPRMTGSGFGFVLHAYTNRSYIIEASDTLPNWTALRTNFQSLASTPLSDVTAPSPPHRWYRARSLLVAPPEPPAPPVTISLLAYTNVWKFEQTTSLDGATWTASTYDDSAWASGPGLLAVTGSGSIAQPVLTPLTLGRLTYYFRTAFTAPTNVLSDLLLTHFYDDGAVVYLNGQEAYRYNLPGGAVTYTNLASGNISGAPAERGPFSLPLTNLVSGVNVLAVEIHQASAGSADLYMGLQLDGLSSPSAP